MAGPVGSSAARFTRFGARLDPPWTVLPMTDGVWKYVGWDRLVEAMAEWRGQGLVDVLQQAARLPGSGQFPDDFTLVLCEESGQGGPGKVRVRPNGVSTSPARAGGRSWRRGEITFQIAGGTVSVEAVTNQSTGYCPEPESWPAVAAALEAAGIAPPDGHTTELVFRRCPGCGQINVVKDQLFECAVCGAELPLSWNLDGKDDN